MPSPNIITAQREFSQSLEAYLQLKNQIQPQPRIIDVPDAIMCVAKVATLAGIGIAAINFPERATFVLIMGAVAYNILASTMTPTRWAAICAKRTYNKLAELDPNYADNMLRLYNVERGILRAFVRKPTPCIQP